MFFFHIVEERWRWIDLFPTSEKSHWISLDTRVRGIHDHTPLGAIGALALPNARPLRRYII
jgi:hypothetical protein